MPSVVGANVSKTSGEINPVSAYEPRKEQINHWKKSSRHAWVHG
jgi:hypothetical protein